ncbi:4917_t:CDS:2 [Gigaspora margarita]|uniref:4917_t:CDS:1 n=1 Tax=Gigaspora margarita TaxID=4874 RepID=A0ABN7VR99_GIGMA|nr:4917_t:CDS:2 [Gigaspora margarita]
MPCYADMIIKIKYVKQSEKDAKVPSVWALGTYPPGHEDNEMEEHVSAELPSSNPTRSKLMNVHQNATNKVSENNLLKLKSEEFDNMDNNKDNKVDDIKDHQPKTEKPVQMNQNFETNNEDKGGSGKNGKRST